MAHPSVDEILTGQAIFVMACIRASRYQDRYMGTDDLDKLSKGCADLRQALEAAESLVQRVKSGQVQG